MQKYLALLRGINVGGNNKVEMLKLKNIFESLGFFNVVTYINSGNVIFITANKDIDALTRKIETTLKKKLGFEVKILLRSSDNVQLLVEKIPRKWKNDAEQRTDVLFLWDEYDNKNTISLTQSNPDVDELRYFPGAIVWNLKRSNYSKTGMRKFIGTPVYKNMTARNINTVRKIADLMKSIP
ncbi:MAG: DUF1697 domain-containing protein [Candidatus Moranbacteria bacterium]|nr:DUF1697 domain-containing protein [Candidatus Moranbacteria bacterium]